MTMKHNEIHIFWREDIKHWCARTLLGDYGISEDLPTIYKIAEDTMFTTTQYNRIIVHDKIDNKIKCTITRVKNPRKPSSQFFQDSVS